MGAQRIPSESPRVCRRLWGVAETLWLRLRAAWLEETVVPEDGTDFRVILRYEIPVI